MRATTTRFGMATAGLLLLLPLLLLSACDAGSPPESASTNLSATSNTAAPSSVARVNFTDAPDLDEVAELDWSALIPADWRPEQLLENLTADGESLDAIGDEDPRAGLIMDKIKALWEEAPLVEALDGQRVKLPGFVVPLEFDFDELSEFLLVPYYGACIHVPPPRQTKLFTSSCPRAKPITPACSIWSG
nr:DUF3299 domain-containing protein [Rhabdochromatium marinum]